MVYVIECRHMPQSMEEFFQSAQAFIDFFNVWAHTYSPTAIADHICYKCSTAMEFEALRKLFEDESAFIYQSIISHRRISVIKFLQPLPTALGNIFYLELSDQKPDGSQTSGFDHIEIYPSKGSVDQLVGQLTRQGIVLEKIVRPHHTTVDLTLESGYKIRIEPEPLIEKIKREEII